MKAVVITLLIALTFAAGLAWGQDGKGADKGDLETRLAAVRREIKIIDFDDTLKRFPALLERENAYQALVERMESHAKVGTDITPLLEQGHRMKLAALKDLNEILRLHRGKYTGLTEQQVYERLRNARFRDVHYEDEWLVNILDDLEEIAEINIEMDARIYKFDTVSFDFEKTSARAMLQMMGDSLYFNWIVRGDTLYVYKERHEVLFGGDWIRKKKAAWKARQKALDAATKEAEAKALEGSK